ncbi:MFS transporter [Micromonospora zingiberis]|uniref:MFS transporter n=1 Tax=Micromonospora zingiberis TaxID=2053011 RepID=A0A4R0GI57_9ACTN|nr:MFS transporter [Micromonospora zingiberis]TCB97164.1 MFS transporter [Micromonospora zingiberis]
MTYRLGRPGRLGPIVVAQTAAAGFSSFPSPFYHRIAGATGSPWTTTLLFVAHGTAAAAAMALLTRPALAARVTRLGPGRLIPALLLIDAAGAVPLILAPEPAGVGPLLLGRIITGAAMGALTPLTTTVLAQHRHGTVLATGAIFGGVGGGALIAGALAASGLPREAVFGIGALGLLAAAAAAGRRQPDVHRPAAEDPGGDRPVEPVRPEAPAPPPRATGGGNTLIIGGAALAFTANGVLGLFSSTLPGLIAERSGGSELVAGASAGLVLLAAGAARLGVTRAPAAVVRGVALAVALLGTVMFVAGLRADTVPVALTGGILLGAAAGIGYDTALAVATGHRAQVRLIARVQYAGQLGLVLPVAAYPLVVPP